jgi:hypothetical protein
MLRAVGHPVAVNPDKRLEREARRNGWPIVHFRQRSKLVVRRTMGTVGTVGVAAVSFALGAKLSSRKNRSFIGWG